MPKIRVLPDILASQVAAGEVVERPASVVKELVENSIDAGAREIRVEIDRGGAALIRVTDDGCGMSREDALLCLERHATSKLHSSGDLAAIRTLGFRGEAIPSIASVSRFRLQTREPEQVAGTEIAIEGGKMADVRETGCAPGTRIEVRNLFFNVPARRKFLRAEATEAAHIEHQLRLHALAAPQVRFRLVRDERVVFDLPAAPKAIERVRNLLGTQVSSELIALPPTMTNGVSVEGFVLPAAHARKGRRHQCVFLNGRPVEDGVIARALADGFRGAIADGMYPAAWLWLDVEPHLVDVNVHPAKREVRFHRPADIREAITTAVLAGLRPAPTLPEPLQAGEKRSVPLSAVPLSAPVPQAAPRPFAATHQTALPLAAAAAPDRPAPEPVVSRAPAFRLLGLLHHRYVVLEGEEGLVWFDPKAARERILYESLMRHRGDRVESQGLLVPVLLELDPRDGELLLRERTALAALGLEIESFGGTTVQIRSLPAGLDWVDPRAFMEELLDALLHEAAPGGRFAFDRIARLIAKRAGAAAAVRLAEVFPLLEELFACELPYCTPAGRPTLSAMALRELDKRFGDPG